MALASYHADFQGVVRQIHTYTTFGSLVSKEVMGLSSMVDGIKVAVHTSGFLR